MLTPHQSGHTEEVFAGRAGDITDNVDALAAGRPLRTWICAAAARSEAVDVVLSPARPAKTSSVCPDSSVGELGEVEVTRRRGVGIAGRVAPPEHPIPGARDGAVEQGGVQSLLVDELRRARSLTRMAVGFIVARAS